MSFVFSPEWFYGIDSLFEIVSLIILLWICIFSYKAYRLCCEKKYAYFSLAFLLLAISFMAKILSNLAIYTVGTQIIPTLSKTFAIPVIQRDFGINFYSYIVFIILTLIAFMILVVITLKIKSKLLGGLLFYLAIISGIFSSYKYFQFHLTLALMIGILVYLYYVNYKKQKSNNAMIVFISFSLILLSQLVFIFTILNQNFYVVGEILQVIGYLVLLISFIMVRKKCI